LKFKKANESGGKTNSNSSIVSQSPAGVQTSRGTKANKHTNSGQIQ